MRTNETGPPASPTWGQCCMSCEGSSPRVPVRGFGTRPSPATMLPAAAVVAGRPEGDRGVAATVTAREADDDGNECRENLCGCAAGDDDDFLPLA